MGIFSKMKNAVTSKANAAIDKATDPEKEIELLITDLEEQRKAAYKDLLGYKTTAKQMEQDMARCEARAADLENKAMIAVKAGKDELARTCLREKKQALEELVRIRRDRDEAAGYAIELNKSRKQVETRLQILKLKKGTMATQIAAARSGGGPLGANDLFERLDEAGERIDDDAIMAEVQAAMEGEDGDTAELEAKLLSTNQRGESDDALLELKTKMAASKAKQLKE